MRIDYLVRVLSLHLTVPAEPQTVLYERPPQYKGLGSVFAASYQPATLEDPARVRILFVKRLLLALFELHIGELTDLCRRTVPSTTREMLKRGVANVPTTIAQIRNCTEYCTHVGQLAAMTGHCIDNIELEFPDSVPTSLAEYLLELRTSSTWLVQISHDNTQRYESSWTAYRDTLNVRESQGVRRLTLLATIFLPLSLASSILAMSTRFRDLHLLLFDFVAVFTVLSSVALLIYSTIAVGNWISEQLRRFKVLKVIEQTAPVLLLGFGEQGFGRFCYFAAVFLWTLLTIASICGMFFIT